MDWIRDLFSGAIGSIRNLANQVRSALVNFWNTLAATFTRWFIALNLAKDRAADTVVQVGAFVVELFATLVWMLVNKLPHEIATLSNALKKYATAAVKTAWNELVRLIDAAKGYALGLVGAAKALIKGWFDTLRSLVDKAWTLLSDISKRVYSLLTVPAVLAEWLAGAMVTAILKWLRSNAEALARMLINSTIRIIMSSIPTIERIIVDLFI